MDQDALNQSSRQSSSGGGRSVVEFDDADTDTATIQVTREPFWAFVPKVASWATGIVAGEVNTGRKAVMGFPAWSIEYLNETVHFYRENPRTLANEVLSGLTVAVMQVPESIAFSFVAGVPPLSGLHATFWMACITGLLGGKPAMISGAAGALAVVVTDLTADDGELENLTADERLNVLYMTMFVCGVAQIVFAWLRLANLVKLIPQTGLIGFMDGLAIIIFMAQLPAFQKCTAAELFVDCTVDQREWLTFGDDTWVLLLTLLHVAICMGIMKGYPMIPKIGKILPASLVSLLVGTFLEHIIFRPVLDVETRTVKETAQMSGSLPKFDWPQVPTDSSTISTIISYAITLAAIGGVESVLTLQACNEITDTVPLPRDSNQELFAQGLANLACGLFRAMGGDAMIGQSTINIMNGARYRVSATCSGIFMLLFVVALSPFIELLPVATLTGVLFMVVLSTFQWKTFIILRYGRLSDSIAILAVTLIAVFFNLAVAIAVGIVFSALVHAWDSGTHVDADVTEKSMVINGVEHDHVKYFKIKGAIFFSSVRKFINMFDVMADPDMIILDFEYALVVDHSAVAAIHGITHRFAKVGKKVLLVNLGKKCHGRLHRTGDHKMLRRQITPAFHLHHGSETREDDDVKDATAEDVEQPTPSESPLPPLRRVPSAGSAATPPPSGHLGEGSSSQFILDGLPMFSPGLDPVEVEVEVLYEEQGEWSIHEKKEK